MGWWILHRIRNYWPFWNSKKDDLKISDTLVQPLPIPDSTKQFVFALRDPDNSSVVYLLVMEKLSERSSQDADCLVRAIKPKLVVAQIGPSSLDDVREERNISVPTSSLAMLKDCFLERINSSKYEKSTGTQVLKIIFGMGFYGHVLAAKQAAVENQSLFLFLETPQKNGHYSKLGAGSKPSSSQNGLKETSQGSGSSEGLTTLSGDMAAASSLINPNSLTLAGPVDNLALRAFVSDSGSNSAPAVISSPAADDYIPSFAHPFYNLLIDLQEIFKDLPAINKALAYVGKMLADVEK